MFTVIAESEKNESPEEDEAMESCLRLHIWCNPIVVRRVKSITPKLDALAYVICILHVSRQIATSSLSSGDVSLSLTDPLFGLWHY